MPREMAYYRITGRGGFKWGRRLCPGDIVELGTGEQSLPAYFEPATELDYTNYLRKRAGRRPLASEAERAKAGREDRGVVLMRVVRALDDECPFHWTDSGKPDPETVTDILLSWGEPPLTTDEIQSLELRRRRKVPPKAGGRTKPAKPWHPFDRLARVD